MQTLLFEALGRGQGSSDSAGNLFHGLSGRVCEKENRLIAGIGR